MSTTQTLAQIVKKDEAAILAQWLSLQTQSPTYRPDLMKQNELRAHSAEFLRHFQTALESGTADVAGSTWAPVREFLASISRSRAAQGFKPSETATFVFSLKQPLFQRVRDVQPNKDQAVEDVWVVSTLIDQLGLFTTEIHQKGREEIILRQHQDMLELSTPVVTLWEGVLGLPLIGTLDSGRTQTVMEALLARIVETGAEIAIIDITGVPTVDTLTAQHLIKTITATRLMGADCIISGIRPQIAQTIVHLGVNLGDVTTKATLAGALQLALARIGVSVVKGKRQPHSRLTAQHDPSSSGGGHHR